MYGFTVSPVVTGSFCTPHPQAAVLCQTRSRPALARARTSQRKGAQVFAVAARGSPKSPKSSDEGAEKSSKRSVRILSVDDTNGGWMVDAEVTNFRNVSKHTVILGRRNLNEIYGEDSAQAPAADIVTWCLEFFMENGIGLKNTTGMIAASQFPVNYFSMRLVFLHFPDFKDYLAKKTADYLALQG